MRPLPDLSQNYVSAWNSNAVLSQDLDLSIQYYCNFWKDSDRGAIVTAQRDFIIESERVLKN
jgi:hypothetical protein